MVIGTPYLFNGKELDLETGLYYYGARYMEPNTSIWYGVDPLAEFYPNISTYTYCAGNPIGCRDENGEWLNFVVGAVVGAATDYGLQVAINLAEGKDLGDALTDVDEKSIGTSAVLGATGAGILSKVGKIVKTGKGLQKATQTGKNVKKFSKYEDVTKSRRGKLSTTNKKTDVSKPEFERNLEKSGYKKTKVNDKVNELKKEGSSYTTRPSKSGEPSADFRKNASQKKADVKIRLEKE